MDRSRFKKMIREGYYSPRYGVYVHGRDQVDIEDVMSKLATKYKVIDNDVTIGTNKFVVSTRSNIITLKCELYQFDYIWQERTEKTLARLKDVLNLKKDGNWSISPKDSNRIYLELTFVV